MHRLNNLIILILLSFLFLSACGSKTKDNLTTPIIQNPDSIVEISINDDDEALEVLKLDTLIDKEKIEFIPLETSENAIFAVAEYIFFLDSSYIIVDTDINFIGKFSMSGHFIKHIGRIGKGPNEFINISNIKHNKFTNTIDVRDRSHKLIKYDVKSGEPVEGGPGRSLVSKFNTLDFEPIDENTYALYNGSFISDEEGPGENYRFGYWKNGNLLYQSLPFKPRTPRNDHRVVRTNYSFYHYRDSIRFFERFNPVIYSVTGKGLLPKYKISFSSASKLKEIDLEDPIADLDNNHFHAKAPFLNRVFEFKDYLFITYATEGDRARLYSIYDVSNDKSLGVSLGFTPYYIEEINIYTAPVPVNDHILVDALEASSILEAQKLIRERKEKKYSTLVKKIMDLKVNEEDNDVLILIRMKR